MRKTLSRRAALRAAGAGAMGIGTAAVLAACGESEPEPAPAAPAAAAAPAATAAPAMTEAPAPAMAEAPQAESVTVRYVSDHTSGPRGAAMQWGLREYAKSRPNINIRFEPQPADYRETFPLQMAAGTQAEVAMLDGGMLGAFVADGGFTQINDVLAKRDDYNIDEYYFIPDLYTVNFDHSHGEGGSVPTVIEGDQFGMPFQGATGGILMNVDLGEKAGIEFPSEGWTYAEDYLESARKATNPDTDEWGSWARNDYEFQWAPMCFGSGGLAYRNADETGLAVFDNGGDWGLKFSVGMIHDTGVSFPDAESKRVSGEFGNPFASGKVWSWLGSGVYSSGFHVPRIKDRFSWSLGPMPIGPGGFEVHSWNDQPNLVTNGAQRLGTIEEAVDLTVFLGSSVYQGRVAIDRGHLPMIKTAFNDASATNPPPDGMEWLQRYADAPESRHLMMALPNWWEMNEWRNAFISAAYLGDVSVDEAISGAEKWVSSTLDSQRDQLNAARQKFGFPAL